MKISIGLVRPQYASNIGQVSRAMSNLGFYDLHIANPPLWTEETFFKARQGAARAQEPLQNRTEHDSVLSLCRAQGAEALRIGFSRRPGKLRPLQSWQNYLRHLGHEDLQRPHILLFGPEDSGLSSDDLDLAHHVCELPTYGGHGSYNLAQAVLLSLYILRQEISPERLDHGVSPKESKENTATDLLQEETPLFPDKALKEWLQTLGFDLSNRSVNAYTVLRRFLLRQAPTPKELDTLEAIIFQTVRKLRAASPKISQDENREVK